MSGIIIFPIILIYIFIAFLIYKLVLKDTKRMVFTTIFSNFFQTKER